MTNVSLVHDPQSRDPAMGRIVSKAHTRFAAHPSSALRVRMEHHGPAKNIPRFVTGCAIDLAVLGLVLTSLPFSSVQLLFAAPLFFIALVARKIDAWRKTV